MKVLTEGQQEISGGSLKVDTKINSGIQLILNENENAATDVAHNGLKLSGTIPGVSELLPWLYLCGASVTRPDVLDKLQISFVVNAAPELPDTPLPDSNPLYLRVPVMDHSDVDLSIYFDEVSDLIESVRLANGKALVHCVAGVSRSASLCLVYLMKHMGMSLRDAFFHIRSIRPQIRPNMGFFRQLIAYEELIHGKSTVKWIFYESIQKEVPDVYENEYRNMEIFYQKYRQNIKRR